MKEPKDKTPVRRDERHITETPDVSYIENPDVAHEHSDVNVRGIMWFVLGLGVLTLVSFLIVRGMFKLFEAQAKQDEPPPAPMAMKGDERLPPEPRLQLAPGHETHPLEEWRQVQAHNKEELNSYGVVDAGMGTMRMPIAVAEQKFLESNPPVRPQNDAAQQTQQPSSSGPSKLFFDMPSYYSSGRMTETRRQ